MPFQIFTNSAPLGRVGLYVTVSVRCVLLSPSHAIFLRIWTGALVHAISLRIWTGALVDRFVEAIRRFDDGTIRRRALKTGSGSKGSTIRRFDDGTI